VLEIASIISVRQSLMTLSLRNWAQAAGFSPNVDVNASGRRAGMYAESFVFDEIPEAALEGGLCLLEEQLVDLPGLGSLTDRGRSRRQLL
jgi:hypothetical protein